MKLHPISPIITDDTDFSLVILSSILYMLLGAIFGSNQAFVFTLNLKQDISKRFDYTNISWQIADRTFLNFVENSTTFFVITWIHAIFIDTEMAGTLSFIAVSSRILYPFFRSIHFLFIELSTQPYYFCVCIMQFNILYKILYDRNVVYIDTLTWNNSGYMILAYLFLQSTVIACSMIMNQILNKLQAKYQSQSQQSQSQDDKERKRE